jgi:hypothetical protein
MWPDTKRKQSATKTLVALLNVGNKELTAVVMDVFRLTDQLIPDEPTIELLRTLAIQIRMCQPPPLIS